MQFDYRDVIFVAIDGVIKNQINTQQDAKLKSKKKDRMIRWRIHNGKKSNQDPEHLQKHLFRSEHLNINTEFSSQKPYHCGRPMVRP
jgi:hypothetical protein